MILLKLFEFITPITHLSKLLIAVYTNNLIMLSLKVLKFKSKFLIFFNFFHNKIYKYF